MSLQKCKSETTFFEFLQWIEFLNEEEEGKLKKVEKQDFYLAQIAAVVVASNAKDPKGISISDFLMKLNTANTGENKKLTKEERTKRAKAFWMQIPAKKGKLSSRKIKPN